MPDAMSAVASTTLFDRAADIMRKAVTVAARVQNLLQDIRDVLILIQDIILIARGTAEVIRAPFQHWARWTPNWGLWAALAQWFRWAWVQGLRCSIQAKSIRSHEVPQAYYSILSTFQYILVIRIKTQFIQIRNSNSISSYSQQTRKNLSRYRISISKSPIYPLKNPSLTASYPAASYKRWTSQPGAGVAHTFRS